MKKSLIIAALMVGTLLTSCGKKKDGLDKTVEGFITRNQELNKILDELDEEEIQQIPERCDTGMPDCEENIPEQNSSPPIPPSNHP